MKLRPLSHPPLGRLRIARVRGTSYTVSVISQGLAIPPLKCADHGISAQDLDGAMHRFANLQAETARRVLDFYHTRLRTRSVKAPIAASA